jgi:UDP-glucuronate 4-epimerase
MQEDVAVPDAMQALWQKHGPFLEVVHLAAQPGVRYSIENPYAYLHSNLAGHLTVMEMCRHTEGFKHLVYASSSSVYGDNAKLPYSVEDQVDRPVSLYAATKKSNELMSYSYSRLYGIPQTGLRFFTVYGPWGRPDMAYFIFTKAITEGKTLPVFNNGEMKRDFTYIDDIVSGILGALRTPPTAENGAAPHRALNIGNNKSETLMHFIKTIEKAVGRDAVLEFLPMQSGDVKETYADITETTELTGYYPETGLEKGIPEFVAWYKDYYKTV